MCSSHTKEPASPAVKPASQSAAPRPKVDFACVREHVTMEQVLQHLGYFASLRGRGQQRRGPCPVHSQPTAPERTFSVHLGKNAFQCFHAESLPISMLWSFSFVLIPKPIPLLLPFQPTYHLHNHTSILHLAVISQIFIILSFNPSSTQPRRFSPPPTATATLKPSSPVSRLTISITYHPFFETHLFRSLFFYFFRPQLPLAS